MNNMSNLPTPKITSMGFEDQREQSRRAYSFSRSLLDYVVGAIVIGFGVIFLKPDHFGIKQIQLADNDKLLIPLFGGVCIIYGIWRLYRGYKKNY
jgi:hypothetical protein